MKIDHLLITRFSCRLRKHARRSRSDPLSAANLKTRFSLLETVALPSVLAQSNQDFGWIITIDPDLDAASRERLESLLAPKERAWLREYRPSPGWSGTEGLTPYVAGEPDYLLTTKLADDDALPVDYFRAMRQDATATSRIPPARIYGTSQPVQWDLLPSPDAPLGWTSPWHRKWSKVTGAGMSLLARFPECPIQVYGLSHVFTLDYLDSTRPPPDAKVAKVRADFAEVFEECGERLEDWPASSTFADLRGVTGPVLVTNHRKNIQGSRILETKRGAAIVRGPEDFPGIVLDWDKVPACLKDAGLSGLTLGVRRRLRKIRRTRAGMALSKLGRSVRDRLGLLLRRSRN